MTFSPLSRRQIEADFSGGHITSDAGLLLLREVDKQHRLTQRLSSVLNDPRNPELVRHKLETMTRQRVFGVAAGYQDLNDHEALRFDQALQTAMSEDDTLAGKSTTQRRGRALDVGPQGSSEPEGKVSATYRFQYQARTWKHPRWVVARLEEGELGSNPRFIISSRYDDGFKLYYEQYCARGDMENRIKDQQLCLFADRTSSTQWWANQWRLILSGFAYTLFERLRVYLKNTRFERMSASNLRLKLIKVGAVIIRNTRRIRVLMSDGYPYKDELSALVRRLVPD